MTPLYLPGCEPDEIKPLLNKLIKELDSAFPDRTVVLNEWDHERWDRTAGVLCNYLGYERGRDLLAAYGYSIVIGDRQPQIRTVEPVQERQPRNTTAEVIKAAAISAIGEDSTNELAKYGRAAADVGRRAAKSIGDRINSSDNESVKLVRGIVSEIRGSSSEKKVQSSQDKENLRLKKVLCPNCGGTLSVEDGIDVFFCEYCGTRVVLENQSDATVKAKETVKKLQHKEAIADKLIDQFNTMSERKAEEKRRQEERDRKVIPISIAMVAVCFLILIGMTFSSKREAAKEEAALQKVVEEVQKDISLGKYDEALVKANGIYYTSSSGETRRKWNNTRETLIEQIESLKVAQSTTQVTASESEGGVAAALQPQDDNASEISTNTASSAADKREINYHSSGSRDTAKNGDSGVYAYSTRGREYSIYFIVDFDEGYVYRFLDSEETCDKVRIDSGTLNDYIEFTYHDGDDVWTNAISFKYVYAPEHAILQDGTGYEVDLFTADLQEALSMRDSRRIVEF